MVERQIVVLVVAGSSPVIHPDIKGFCCLLRRAAEIPSMRP